MVTNYYFAVTPLNVLNALELRDKTAGESLRHVLVIMADYPPTLDQIDGLVTDGEWAAVLMPFAGRQLSKITGVRFVAEVLGRRSYLTRIFKNLDPQDNIAVGNVVNPFCRYVCTLAIRQKRCVTYFDDGFATISHYESLLAHGRLSPSMPRLRLGSVFRIIENSILRPSRIVPTDLAFFTAFDLSYGRTVDPSLFPITIRNDFSRLRRLCTPKTTINAVYFIGQPMVALKQLEEKVYVETVNWIFEYYTAKGFDPFYLPHRSGTRSYIPGHWNVREFGGPLESEMARSSRVPSVFASFYSTALYNLSIILDTLCTFDFWYTADLIRDAKLDPIWNYIERESKIRTNISLAEVRQ